MGSLHSDDVLGHGTVPACKHCGSERVVKDAWACWNPASGLWEIENVFDQEFCQVCERETTLVWNRNDGDPRGAVRELNDRFRQDGLGHGSVVVTSGLQAHGPEFLLRAVDAVRSFDAFTTENDPWGEHDYGAVEIDGETVFWKIDCYDATLTMASENPGNDGLTHRVLTIMLASEY